MVSPQFRAQRKTSITRAVNLIPYREDYFDHKLHLDKNEKLMARLLSKFYVKTFNLQTILIILLKLSALIFATFEMKITIS